MNLIKVALVRYVLLVVVAIVGLVILSLHGCALPDGSSSPFYAQWSCGGYENPSQQQECISAMGTNTGITGPFTQVSDCQQWVQATVNAVYFATGNINPFAIQCIDNLDK